MTQIVGWLAVWFFVGMYMVFDSDYIDRFRSEMIGYRLEKRDSIDRSGMFKRAWRSESVGFLLKSVGSDSNRLDMQVKKNSLIFFSLEKAFCLFQKPYNLLQNLSS